MSRRSVIVLGGGLSGLVAAAQVADCGFRVTLLERTPSLGGRLTPLTDPRSGRQVGRWPTFALDLGPELLASLRRVGASSWIACERETTVPIVGATPGQLAPSSLPGLFRLWPSLVKDRELGWLDRLQALRALYALWQPRSHLPDTISFYRHLRQLGQGNRIIGRLWNPLCVLATGLPVEEASAEIAHRTIRKALLRGSGAPGMTILSGGLDGNVARRFVSFIEARGGTVLTDRPAHRLIVSGGEVKGVEVSGEILSADGYVSALPPDELLTVLPERWGAHPALAPARHVHWTPLVSVHLFFDRLPMPWRLAISSEGEGLWFAGGPAGPARLQPGHLAVHAPGGARYLELCRDEIVSRMQRLMHELVPATHGAVLEHALVIRHERAFVSVRPGSAAGRLPTATPLGNLWLAGSWTEIGAGGGLEGAVASGRAAAVEALRSLGRRLGPIDLDAGEGLRHAGATAAGLASGTRRLASPAL